MREILFRGKLIDNGEWVYGSFCMDALEQFNGLCGVDGFIRLYDKIKGEMRSYKVERETVGQFTGLKDKNGKRIFEGDIVVKRTYNGNKNFAVSFGGGMFHCGYGGGSSTPTHRYTLEDKQIRVIGNIHDNPELLKED